MDEQLDRLQDRDGRFSAVVRLVHCVTGPRLRRQYLMGADQAVDLGRWALFRPPGRYTQTSVLVQGLPYTPNKLEQYAECVVIAVSVYIQPYILKFT